MTDIKDLGIAAGAAMAAVERNRSLFKSAAEALDRPLLNAVKALENNSAIQRMLADVERHQRLINSVEGPLAELRAAGVFDQASRWQKEFERTQRLMADFDSRFILPDTSGIAALARELDFGQVARLAKQCSEQASEIQAAMEAMQTPWLDAQRTLQSVTGFAEIQGIGRVLEQIPAFDDRVTVALRESLGDWRDPISWPKNIITDLVARSEFYDDLGFDSDLTYFPAPAFQESLVIAGLRRNPPQLIAEYGSPVPISGHDEEALARTNIAHDLFQRLETNLRQFIDLHMTRVYGSDWPKHGLPNGLYDKWVEKKRAAERAGRGSWPLIAFADFTDYGPVICKKDNWREVFGGLFGRPESVRESFQRLHMIRLDTMHARPIGQDDELLLYVEVRRLIKVVLRSSD